MTELSLLKGKNASKFLVTPELSRLASWLRLLGFDACIANSSNIKDCARICSIQKRILITRVRKNQKLCQIENSIIVTSDQYCEQLKQVITELNLRNFNLFSRCMCCNRKVYSIEKNKILHRLPEKVKNREQTFTICRKCGRVYWKGTHFEAMLQKLNSILAEIVGKKIDEFVLTDFR